MISTCSQTAFNVTSFFISFPPPPCTFIILPGVVLPSVSVRQLFRMLSETPDLVLVLDSRTRASYTASHTDKKKCPQWLSVPEELILKGYVCKMVSRPHIMLLCEIKLIKNSHTSSYTSHICFTLCTVLVISTGYKLHVYLYQSL